MKIPMNIWLALPDIVAVIKEKMLPVECVREDEEVYGQMILLICGRYPISTESGLNLNKMSSIDRKPPSTSNARPVSERNK